MTVKGIAQLRKKYRHVNSMEPQQLKEFEGQLLNYINTQRLAMSSTRKEVVHQEVSPALKEAEEMQEVVRKRIVDSR